MEIEKKLFEYIDAIGEQEFKEAVNILEDILEKYEDQREILTGFKNAALTLDALKYGEFNIVEELWESYILSKKYLDKSSRYYSIYLEMSLIVEDAKDYIEKII